MKKKLLYSAFLVLSVLVYVCLDLELYGVAKLAAIVLMVMSTSILTNLIATEIIAKRTPIRRERCLARREKNSNN